VQLVVRDGRIEMKGKLRKGIVVPFSAKASVGVTDDGRMKLHVESMKAIGVPAKGLLEPFGLEVDDLMTLTKRGVTIRAIRSTSSPRATTGSSSRIFQEHGRQGAEDLHARLRRSP
jgi:hypothetical protein